MKTRIRCSVSVLGLVGLATLLCLPEPARAQTAQPTWRVRPIASFRLGTDGRFGIFGPTESIELELTIRNTPSTIPLVLDAGLFPATDIRLTRVGSNEAVPVEINWTVPVQCTGTPAAAPCTISSRIVLQPRDTASALATVRPAAGSIMPGEYRISVDFSGARERLRQADLAPWSGTFPNTSSLSLIVQEPHSEGERSIALQLTGRQALGHSDWTGALAQFQHMVEIDPASEEAHAGMGSALLQLGRFAEAAMELEQALPQEREESAVTQDLALAYVAMGSRDRAETLLRRYYQPSRLPEILANILERAERLPTQP